MSGADIAAEVKQALGEASSEVGSGSPLVGTIVRKGPKTGPVYDPQYGPDKEYDFNVVLSTFSLREREGTAILATDTKILCSVGEVVPSTGDKVEVAGTTYEVYGVDPTNPGGVDIVYKLWARS